MIIETYKFKYIEKDGVYHMCKAWEDQYREDVEKERERMTKLIGILMEAGDYDGMRQIVSDPKLCEGYYERYGI